MSILDLARIVIPVYDMVENIGEKGENDGFLFQGH